LEFVRLSGVSNKVETAIGMTGAVTFVMVISTTVTYLLQKYVLIPLDLAFLQTIIFILVIATLVQMVENCFKKSKPGTISGIGHIFAINNNKLCCSGNSNSGSSKKNII